MEHTTEQEHKKEDCFLDEHVYRWLERKRNSHIADLHQDYFIIYSKKQFCEIVESFLDMRMKSCRCTAKLDMTYMVRSYCLFICKSKGISEKEFDEMRDNERLFDFRNRTGSGWIGWLG